MDARTLLQTPRKTEQIFQLGDGEYCHFGLERAVKSMMRDNEIEGKPNNHLKLAINVDGLPIFKSTAEGFWLILCSQLHSNKVYPIGAFYGEDKPKCANEFFRNFVEEAISLSTNGMNDGNTKISFPIFTFDTPAKAFALFLKGHMGYESCTKCKIHGEYVVPKRKNAKRKERVCFPGTGPF